MHLGLSRLPVFLPYLHTRVSSVKGGTNNNHYITGQRPICSTPQTLFERASVHHTRSNCACNTHSRTIGSTWVTYRTARQSTRDELAALAGDSVSPEEHCLYMTGAFRPSQPVSREARQSHQLCCAAGAAPAFARGYPVPPHQSTYAAGLLIPPSQ